MTPGAYAFIAFVVALFGWILWEIWMAPDAAQYGWQDAGVDEWEDGV